MHKKEKQDLLKYERDLYKKGIKLIAGVDEVGRGPLAGPLVVCSVLFNVERILNILEHEFTNNDVSDAGDGNDEEVCTKYRQINDSKVLSHNKRFHISKFILSECITYSISEIPSDFIDKRGMGNAIQEGFYNSVKNLKTKPDFIITDYVKIKNIDEKIQLNITKGDSLSICVASASIVAKVYRDTLMLRMHKKYPIYGFDRHKGYGTKKHIDAINEHGVCKIHRMSFEPIKSLINTK